MSATDALAFFGVTNKSSACVSNLVSYAAEDNILIAIHEGPMAFWHMKLANLIEGNYDGEYLTAEEVGVTVGSSSYDNNAGYSFLTLGKGCNRWSYGVREVYVMVDKNALIFGKIGVDSSGFASDSILKPADAYNIDNKLDDGYPNSGIVLADHGLDVGNSQQCTSLSSNASYYTSSDGTLSYMAANDYVACRMMFIMDF
jgi:hypothetical protein